MTTSHTSEGCKVTTLYSRNTITGERAEHVTLECPPPVRLTLEPDTREVVNLPERSKKP